MVSRNPSEIQRVLDMEEELAECMAMLKQCTMSKTDKNILLRNIRQLEEQLNKDSVPYNSERF